MTPPRLSNHAMVAPAGGGRLPPPLSPRGRCLLAPRALQTQQAQKAPTCSRSTSRVRSLMRSGSPSGRAKGCWYCDDMLRHAARAAGWSSVSETWCGCSSPPQCLTSTTLLQPIDQVGGR
jgi:hypothetical protein